MLPLLRILLKSLQLQFKASVPLYLHIFFLYHNVDLPLPCWLSPCLPLLEYKLSEPIALYLQGT